MTLVSQLRAGRGHAEIEALLEDAGRLNLLVALALTRDSGQGSEVLRRLNAWGRSFADTCQALNRGSQVAHAGDAGAAGRRRTQAHGQDPGMPAVTPEELLAAARRLVERPDAATAGVWPRAAALLARQAIELGLAELMPRAFVIALATSSGAGSLVGCGITELVKALARRFDLLVGEKACELRLHHKCFDG